MKRPTERGLPAVLYRWAPFVAFAILSAQSFALLAGREPGVILAWPLLLILAARWPAAGFIAAAVVLRVGFLDACCTDQIIVSQSAWERVISGQGGPWGVPYATTFPPGSPFFYGPLGLIWWLPGSIVELAACLAIMAILAWQRAYLTLAVFAVWEPAVIMTMIGANDYSPGLLILIAWLALRWRPVVGAGILAGAAALKPYAFAWYLPAIGFGGLPVAAILTLGTAVLWSPLLWWGGPAAYLESVRIHERVIPEGFALNLPPLRWLAVPIALAGLLVRRWEWAVLTGTAVFVTFLFFNRWASYAYWFAVIPVSGVAAELLLRQWIGLGELRRTTSLQGASVRALSVPSPAVSTVDLDEPHH